MRKFFGLIRFWFAGIFFLLNFLFNVQQSFAQTNTTLLAWNFNGMNSPVSAPAVFAHNRIISSNLLTRGPGAPPFAGTNSFLTNGFSNSGISTSNTDYFQFTVAVDAADTLSLNSIDIRYLSSIDTSFINPNGVYSQVAYSLNGTDFILIDTPVLSYHGGSNYGSGLGSRPSINLASIPSLQNILNGATITFRYYVSGHTANGIFGFITDFSAIPALAIKGFIKAKKNKITTGQVTPENGYFYLADCNSTVSTSINFTSVGTFPQGNVYIAKINTSEWADDTSWTTVGSLTSSANSGIIDIIIPGTIPMSRANVTLRRIKIESSLVHDASTNYSAEFEIKKGTYCYSPNSIFRTKQSGSWGDVNIWEMSSELSGGTGEWVASTFIPGKAARKIIISAADSITLTSPLEIHNLSIAGKLKVLNNTTDNGSITFHKNLLYRSTDWFYPMVIEPNGIMQIVSSASFDSVIRIYSIDAPPGFEMMKIYGKIIVGDGSSLNGTGFYQFGTSPAMRKLWWTGGKLDWNTTSSNGFTPTRYFFHDDDHATLRLVNIDPDAFGLPGTTTVNGRLEIYAPINVRGTVIVVP